MNKELLELRGIITVLNTPFNDDDAVDLLSLRKNVRYALEAGAAADRRGGAGGKRPSGTGDRRRFRCLKVEVVPAGVKYSEVLAITEGRLHVSGGWAVMQIIEALDRGVHAFMPTGMHELYTRIYDLYQAGRRQEASALFERLLPVLAFANQHLDISVHFFKRLLYKQGIYATSRVREPILPFDQVHEKVAEQLITRTMELCEQLRDLTDRSPGQSIMGKAVRIYSLDQGGET
jgi:dihydrodipicolinate synthase/N-acetylneuraminate lyase